MVRKELLIVACAFSLPVAAQTVHLDSERIAYRGTVAVVNASQLDLFFRAQKAIANYVTSKPSLVKIDAISHEISAEGSVKLKSPYHLIKTLLYTIQLSVKDGAYEYRIDSIYVKETERGGKTRLISSQELLKGMDVSGATSSMMEEQLNEIDMNFQKLIDLVKNKMKEP